MRRPSVSVRQRQVAQQRGVVHRVGARQALVHQAGRQARSLRHGQAVGLGAVGQADAVHRGRCGEARAQLQQHARRLHRLGEKAVHMRAERSRRPSAMPPGAPPTPQGRYTKLGAARPPPRRRRPAAPAARRPRCCSPAAASANARRRRNGTAGRARRPRARPAPPARSRRRAPAPPRRGHAAAPSSRPWRRGTCARGANAERAGDEPHAQPQVAGRAHGHRVLRKQARAGASASAARSWPGASKPCASARRSASSSTSWKAPRAFTEPATGSRWSHLSHSLPEASSSPNARCAWAAGASGEATRPAVACSAGNIRASRPAARSKRCCAAAISALPSSPGVGAGWQAGFSQRQGSAWRSGASRASGLEALGKAGGSGRDMPPLCRRAARSGRALAHSKTGGSASPATTELLSYGTYQLGAR